MRTSRNASTLATLLSWLLDLAVFALARSLQMPQPLVQDTGIYVFAQVQAFENEVGRSLGQSLPVRWLRSLLDRAR